MTTKVTASVLANTTVTPGVYGGSTVVPVITVDGQGRLTSASNTSFSGGATITDDITSETNLYVMMGPSTSGSYTVANTSSTQLYFTPSTGTLSATVFNSLSDLTQKTNIKIVDNATGVINQLEGVEFDWIKNGEKSSGVIAQQIEQILPHLVNENEGIKSVNYDGIIAYLIESIKELSKRIEDLENK